MFADIERYADADGRNGATIEEVLGGPINRRSLLAYRRRFDIPEPRVHGGWTTCVRIETAGGHDIVIDCGSGFRVCPYADRWREDVAPAPAEIAEAAMPPVCPIDPRCPHVPQRGM
ncbi:MAG: hypothetical protein JJT88_11065 [Gammaproteobacteria bacterium]|nr:hypothetical protein [Gammaproteobacteria bacterium]